MRVVPIRRPLNEDGASKNKKFRQTERTTKENIPIGPQRIRP